MDGFRSDRLTRILMQIPFGVLVVGEDGRIAFANRAATGMLSSDGGALEGRPASDWMDPKLRVSLGLEAAGSADRTIPPATALARTGNAARQPPSRWIDHTFERPAAAGLAPDGAEAGGRDGHSPAVPVTLRFWTAAGLLDAAAGEHILFVQDVTQAKEAERARDNFLYHVTHELRTPLTNIRAYAETLSQGVIEDAQTIRECYNVIMGETQRLSRLVEDILNVSQLEVGSARLDVGEVQMDRLLRAVVQDMQGTADAKNIELVLNLPAKMPQLRGDKERLAVVFTNLVGNAIKYTPAGGRVDVRCAAENSGLNDPGAPSRLRVTVTDTGLGIKPEDQEKIFEKFYRVSDEAVSKIPGTGLGLAIVKETVRLHGGSIFVESTPGHGSTFTVSLPAVALEEGIRDRGPGIRT
jgi:signal transduction histidine kinase